MGNVPTTAIIADDEPLLAQALARELRALWPQLSIEAVVADGRAALAEINNRQPDIAFLDIRMPGSTGLEVAEAIAEDWPEGDDARPAPLIVFVTAFDEFAVEAFERAAVDYVLKPVRSDRLARTVERLRTALAARAPAPLDTLAGQLRDLAGLAPAPGPAPQRLARIRAGVGDTVRMIAIDEVVLLEAADKYVNVVTATGEALIRESLRELVPRLDPERFVQIHRSTVVNLDFVEAAHRAENGKMTLKLRGRSERPLVSRLYAHLFRPM